MYEQTLVGPVNVAGAADNVLVIVAVLVTGEPQALLTATLKVPVANVEAKCNVNVLAPAPDTTVAPVGTVHT